MTQFASANFNGLDTALTAVDSNWAQLDSGSGIADIYSNRVMTRAATNPAHYYHSATPPSADYEVSCDLYVVGTTSTALNAGPMARCVVGELTGYWTRWRNGTGIQLFRYNSGTATQLGSTVSYSPTAGTTFRLRLKVQGSVISVYKDAETTAIISVTDGSPLTAAGKTGILVANTFATDGPHLDNFSADTLSTSVDGTALGATLTGTASLTPGSASGERNVTAPGATLTGTGTLTPGAASGTGDAAAPGATLTGTGTLTPGTASGDAAAPGATLTGTASLTPGSASGGSSGTFASSPMENNTGSLLADTAVIWEWRQGSGIGVAPSAVVYGSGTTSAGGILTASGLPAGAGELLVATPDYSSVFYERGTVA